MYVREIPGKEELRAHFVHDNSTGLLYRVTTANGSSQPPKEVVTLTRTVKYKQNRFKKVLYVTHRLIYMLHHGHCPHEIDHIDGDPLNNRIENLRAASREQNSYNKGMTKANTSGYKGVYLNKRTGRWVAEIWLKGVKHYLGSYITVEEAGEAYKKASKIHHGEFRRD